MQWNNNYFTVNTTSAVLRASLPFESCPAWGERRSRVREVCVYVLLPTYFEWMGTHHRSNSKREITDTRGRCKRERVANSRNRWDVHWILLKIWKNPEPVVCKWNTSLKTSHSTLCHTENLFLEFTKITPINMKINMMLTKTLKTTASAKPLEYSFHRNTWKWKWFILRQGDTIAEK